MFEPFDGSLRKALKRNKFEKDTALIFHQINRVRPIFFCLFVSFFLWNATSVSANLKTPILLDFQKNSPYKVICFTKMPGQFFAEKQQNV